MREGKWHPLTERLSRWARIQLLRVLIEDMNRKEIAKACDVTVQAISNWIYRENDYPSDETSDTLLRLALNEDPRKSVEIMRKDVKRYSEELKEIGMKISQVNGDLIGRKN